MEPKEYIRKINVLGIRKLSETKVRSCSDAKDLLKGVRNMQKGLRQIKKEINFEIKTIRLEYKEKSETAGTSSASFVRLLGKKGAARSMRASAKRRVAQERDRRIISYEELKMKIDDMILKMDQLKLQLEQYIQKEKEKANKV